MATATSTLRTHEPSRPGSSRRKKEQRTDIWGSLLRQTREAQARSKTQAVQTRHLLLCGGSAEDQRVFVERYVARPPPAQPPPRSHRDERPQPPKGDVRLSNRFACGYGHATLFSPPQPSSGRSGLLNGEAEEVAKVEIHTIPEAEGAYEDTLRRLMSPKHREQRAAVDEETDGAAGDEIEGRRPAVCILMSWKEPWLFLDRLRRWLALLSRALLPSTAPKDEPALEVLQDYRIRLVVALQHTDQQDLLLRESYTEQTFDYVSQCLRTCLLPLSAALVYVPTNLPPQQLGGALSETQKVLYTSLELNVAALQSKVGKPETAPKHNVVDRMAIVVPSGWDSVGKIRLLSENFSPEAVLEGWTTDLAVPIFPSEDEHEAMDAPDDGAESDQNEHERHANGGAEVYESAPRPPSLVSSPPPSPPMSPSKMPKSAITDYEDRVEDPNAHKVPPPPEIEVFTQPEQEFLADMRAQLVQYEAQDAEKGSFASTNASALNTSKFNLNIAGANATGEALDNLGDVSFNVGGVSYNTLTAGEAIERLKRPQLASPRSDSKSGTPRSGRRDQSGIPDGDFPTEKLEEYFASLMKRGGGSRGSTPSKS